MSITPTGAVQATREFANARITPIVALDVPDLDRALQLVDDLPRADWVKVGLQLFTAAGPTAIRELRARGRHVFLDLKFHDIPNTVARAVESASELEVELLTLHASGGIEMMRAARAAAGNTSSAWPRLFAVTLLTSLSGGAVARVWGRETLTTANEVVRLSAMAQEAGLDGVVASAREVSEIRARYGTDLLVLTPGIRLAGDDVGDQSRVATPAEAARRGADFLVVGRSVTAAAEPAAAFDEVVRQIASTVEH